MNSDTAQRDVLSLRHNNRFLKLIVLSLAVALIIFSFALFKAIGNERIVVVPPNIDKSFWVQRDKVSAPYLFEMGDYVAGMILNVTPTNIEYKRDTLLAHTSPEYHGALKTKLELDGDRIRRDNATMVFWPKTITPKEDTMQVALYGGLQTYVNDRKVGDVEKTYLASFEFKHGRIVLKNFEQTPLDDPFKLKSKETTNVATK